MTYEEKFADDTYCRSELLQARKIFCNSQTSRESYAGMQNMLLIMLIHCSENMKNMVEATYHESETRRQYFEREWFKQETL